MQKYKAGIVGGSLAKHFSRNLNVKVLDVKSPSFKRENNVNHECARSLITRET